MKHQNHPTSIGASNKMLLLVLWFVWWFTYYSTTITVLLLFHCSRNVINEDTACPESSMLTSSTWIESGYTKNATFRRTTWKYRKGPRGSTRPYNETSGRHEPDDTTGRRLRCAYVAIMWGSREGLWEENGHTFARRSASFFVESPHPSIRPQRPSLCATTPRLHDSLFTYLLWFTWAIIGQS